MISLVRRSAESRLLKQKQPVSLRLIFDSKQAKPTLDRVIKYLRPIWRQYSYQFLTWDYLRSCKYAEEFFFAMPTMAAYHAETDLCHAIYNHAGRRINDKELADAVTEYITTHTFIHQDGTRELKSGDFSQWASHQNISLFYVASKQLDFELYLNAMQIRFIKAFDPSADLLIEECKF